MKVIIEEHGKQVTYDLSCAEVTIGRGLENTIPIRDPMASRRHLRLAQEGTGVIARDLGSRNGTSYNGEPLRQATLAPGDCMQIGEIRVWFEVKGEAPPPKKAAYAAGPEDETANKRPEPLPDEPGILAPIQIDDDDEDDDLIAALADVLDEADPAAPEGSGSAGPAPAARPQCRYALLYEGKELDVPGFPFRMGRRKLNHLVLTDSEASGAHAEIVARGKSGAAIVDLQSTNGTEVNGARVQRAALADGARIRIGEVEMVFIDRHAEVAGEGAPARSGGKRIVPSKKRGVPGKRIVGHAAEASAKPAGSASGRAKRPAPAAAAAEASPLDASFLDEPPTLANAAERLGTSSQAAIHEPARGGGLAAIGLLVLVLVGAGIFVVSRLGASDDEGEPDPPPHGNQVADWSFEESALGALGRRGAWVVLTDADGNALGEAEIRATPDAPGGAKALAIRPSDRSAAVIASGKAFPLVTGGPVEVRARLRALGGPVHGVDIPADVEQPSAATAAIGIRWESTEDDARMRIASSPLGASDRWEELRASFLPPPGFDRARVVVLAADGIELDHVEATESDAPARSRRIEVGGLEARLDDRGRVRLLRDDNLLVDAMVVALDGEGPAARLATQHTPLAIARLAPIDDETPGATDPIGWAAAGYLLRPEGAAHAAFEIAATRSGDGEGIAVRARIRGDEPVAGRLTLHLNARASRDLRVGSEGSLRAPYSAEAIEEVSFGRDTELVSLRLQPPTTVRVLADGAGRVRLDVAIPPGEALDLVLGRGSDRERRGIADRFARADALIAEGKLEAARAVYTSVQREFASDRVAQERAKAAKVGLLNRAKGALHEAEAIGQDIEDVRVSDLLAGAEQRCRFVLEAFPGTAEARKAEELLAEVEARRRDLVGAANAAEAERLFTAGQKHLTAKRYRLARLYFRQVVERFPGQVSATDAQQSLDFCEGQIERGDS